ncbi:outer membrane protein assembly factor [Geomonas sp. Red32]|uniref:BamA/TamA family outer membrane protein n=1 Tax=Geomonas sp. Red32 TaxID=2912856 RepID=UPI00202CAA6E|nr:BamA/TamA family outer membrane protein [Geomonas sp. Red32]MCM0081416.1 outer membrane protein assembly factor [Geomonas sp. Red32]
MPGFLIMVMTLLLTGCSLGLPRDYLPPPVQSDFPDPVKTVAIPLPVVATSPNEGITFGGLVAFLLHDSHDQVSALVVPQENYNQYFGYTSSLYAAFYPEPDRSYKLNLAKATTINEELKFRYQDEHFLFPRFYLSAHAFTYADGSARFFGFQSTSQKRNETNYTDHETGIALTVGYRPAYPFEIALGERFKDVDIRPGAVKSLPFITGVFSPDYVPGVEGYHLHAQKLSVLYNTLNSSGMPTEGTYGRISIENSSKMLGSAAPFLTYEAELKLYRPLQEERFISVFRFAFNQNEGNRIPFLEQAILGGETTLRGYGQNRFVDKSYMLVNLEERIRLFRWEVFKVKADWELAPFVDLGTVMRSLVEVKRQSFEFNPGIGIRAVVRPNIVGRIDVGFGKDGPAVFAGLGYPF